MFATYSVCVVIALTIFCCIVMSCKCYQLTVCCNSAFFDVRQCMQTMTLQCGMPLAMHYQGMSEQQIVEKIL